MKEPQLPSVWMNQNHRYLELALNRLRSLIGASSEHADDCEPVAKIEVELAQVEESMSGAPTLRLLEWIFGLSEFERDVLMLCAGMELQRDFSDFIAQRSSVGAPTFGLAFSTLERPTWSSMSPSEPLRRWHLIDLDSRASVVQGPLRIDERILHFLTGVQSIDPRLSGFLQTIEDCDHRLIESQVRVAQSLSGSWSDGVSGARGAPIQLFGGSRPERLGVALAACDSRGFELKRFEPRALEAVEGNTDEVVTLLHRDAVLSGSVILVDLETAKLDQTPGSWLVERVLDQLGERVVVSSPHRLNPEERTLLTFEVMRATRDEQRSVWRKDLKEFGLAIEGTALDKLVYQFDVSAPEIRSACLEVRREQEGREKSDDVLDHAEALWNSCRGQARSRLGNLAKPIVCKASWSDLVLPDGPYRLLRMICDQIANRSKVYGEWGYKDSGSQGFGISVLFAGPSGTGKTLAAEVLANSLHVDLVRVDLATVVNKYIGETEKNLGRIFDAAEASGTALLFDEADALFGKRSEVKDSHDRYANVEVSYLLQRIEAYTGLAILTSNLKDNLDPAFLRRLRFVVDFSFPSEQSRDRIWRTVYSELTPVEGIDPSLLAQLNVTGGGIRNIALNAAFLAAADGSSVGMRHLLRAAEVEYYKIEQPLTEPETKGWL